MHGSLFQLHIGVATLIEICGSTDRCRPDVFPKHRYMHTDMLTLALRRRRFHQPRKRPPPHPLKYLFNTQEKTMETWTASPRYLVRPCRADDRFQRQLGRISMDPHLHADTWYRLTPHVAYIPHKRCYHVSLQNSYSPLSPSLSP